MLALDREAKFVSLGTASHASSTMYLLIAVASAELEPKILNPKP